MPLILPNLVDPLTKLFVSGTQAAEISAEIMATAYTTYASTALFGGAIPVFTGLEKDVLKATLLAAMNPFIPNPAGFGGAWGTGITNFWLSPPVVITGAITGAVTAIPGASSLPGALLPILIIPFAPASVAAAAIAAAIDAATRTTIADGTPPGPYPIS